MESNGGSGSAASEGAENVASVLSVPQSTGSGRSSSSRTALSNGDRRVAQGEHSEDVGTVKVDSGDSAKHSTAKDGTDEENIRSGGQSDRMTSPSARSMSPGSQGTPTTRGQVPQRSIGVYVRVRPLTTFEQANPAIKTVVQCLPTSIVVNPVHLQSAAETYYQAGKTASRARQFDVDAVFHPRCTETDVYERACRHVVEGAFLGINGAILAYGATGAGKTHTMFGGELSAVGVIYQAMRDIFDEKKRLERDGNVVTVRVTFLEVYNEEVFDLLAPRNAGQPNITSMSMVGSPNGVNSSTYMQAGSVSSSFAGSVAQFRQSSRFSYVSSSVTQVKRQALHVRDVGQEETFGTARSMTVSRSMMINADMVEVSARKAANPESLVVAGLTVASPTTMDEFARYVEKGRVSRFVASTTANATSSRSHAIITVEIEVQEKSDMSRGTLARIRFCDLAGSERAASTSNMGIRLREGGNINKSLLALGTVVQALVQRRSKPDVFVPYRGSKLTRLLRDCLGGNCRTEMLFCASPASNNYEETVNTMIFAMQAKRVQSVTKRNEFAVDTKAITKDQDAIIEQLRGEVARLQAALVQSAEAGGMSTGPIPSPELHDPPTTVVREQTMPPSAIEPTGSSASRTRGKQGNQQQHQQQQQQQRNEPRSKKENGKPGPKDVLPSTLTVQSLNDKLAALFQTSTANRSSTSVNVEQDERKGTSSRGESALVSEEATTGGKGEDDVHPASRSTTESTVVVVESIPIVTTASMENEVASNSPSTSMPQHCTPVRPTRPVEDDETGTASERKEDSPSPQQPPPLRRMTTLPHSSLPRGQHSSTPPVGIKQQQQQSAPSDEPASSETAASRDAAFARLKASLMGKCDEKAALYRKDQEAQEKKGDVDLELRQMQWKLADFLREAKCEEKRGPTSLSERDAKRESAGIRNLRKAIAALQKDAQSYENSAQTIQSDLEKKDKDFTELRAKILSQPLDSMLELLLANVQLRHSCTEAECLAAYYHRECRKLLNHEEEYSNALEMCVSALKAALPTIPVDSLARQSAQDALLYATLPVASTSTMLTAFEKGIRDDSESAAVKIAPEIPVKRQAEQLRTVDPLRKRPAQGMPTKTAKLSPEHDQPQPSQFKEQKSRRRTPPTRDEPSAPVTEQVAAEPVTPINQPAPLSQHSSHTTPEKPSRASPSPQKDNDASSGRNGNDANVDAAPLPEQQQQSSPNSRNSTPANIPLKPKESKSPNVHLHVARSNVELVHVPRQNQDFKPPVTAEKSAKSPSSPPYSGERNSPLPAHENNAAAARIQTAAKPNASRGVEAVSTRSDAAPLNGQEEEKDLLAPVFDKELRSNSPPTIHKKKPIPSASTCSSDRSDQRAPTSSGAAAHRGTPSEGAMERSAFLIPLAIHTAPTPNSVSSVTLTGVAETGEQVPRAKAEGVGSATRAVRTSPSLAARPVAASVPRNRTGGIVLRRNTKSEMRPSDLEAPESNARRRKRTPPPADGSKSPLTLSVPDLFTISGFRERNTTTTTATTTGEKSRGTAARKGGVAASVQRMPDESRYKPEGSKVLLGESSTSVSVSGIGAFPKYAYDSNDTATTKDKDADIPSTSQTTSSKFARAKPQSAEVSKRIAFPTKEFDAGTNTAVKGGSAVRGTKKASMLHSSACVFAMTDLSREDLSRSTTKQPRGPSQKRKKLSSGEENDDAPSGGAPNHRTTVIVQSKQSKQPIVPPNVAPHGGGKSRAARTDGDDGHNGAADQSNARKGEKQDSHRTPETLSRNETSTTKDVPVSAGSEPSTEANAKVVTESHQDPTIREVKQSATIAPKRQSLDNSKKKKKK